ncbi:MAG: D-alanyl-D-alanine carboxypeptidase [Burkholderiaceae bacterium]|jgi:D-alanyl-D-alanine carboxypeptidase (penicillin-binding protein 5/6)|nr:D-alanyl-D-alanine carboxypeptidase [Burkholderiaceae bacterium]
MKSFRSALAAPALAGILAGALALTASFSGQAAPAAPASASVAAASGAAPAALVLPQPPDIAAKAYLLLDVTAGGQQLAGSNIDMPVEPASLTKLMTAYLVFDALRAKKVSLTQTCPVSVQAWKTPGSRMFIDPKMQVPVQDLIKGMVVQSGNDATVALAECVGGTVERFVQMMNDQARALGMNATTYKNPDGLPTPGHITTARDLATLALRLMRDFPQDMGYFAIKQYYYPGTPVSNENNRNALLQRDPTVDGLKTGFTNAAGYCLVATARRDFPNLSGRRLLSVVLGTASEAARADESQKLLNWGYTAYDGVKLFDAGHPAATPAVWKGASDTLKLGSADPIIVAVPSGDAARITTEIARPDPLIAPFKQGQKVATLKVKLDGQVIDEVPLAALAAVDEAGFLGRAWDTMRLWLR